MSTDSTRLWTRPFALASVSNFLQGVSFSLFVHFPGFLADLGAQPVEVGWIYGFTAVTAILVRPAVGAAMDRHGRRVVILAGNFLNVAVMGLYFSIDALGPWVYCVRILHGLAEALLFTSLFTYAADHVPAQRRTQGLGVFGVSGMLPMSLGGLLGDRVLAVASYDALFAVAAGFAGAALLSALPLYDRVAPDSAGEPPRSGFLAGLIQRDLLPVWWMTTVFAFSTAAAFTFLKLYVMELGFGTVGGFLTTYTAVAIGMRLFLGFVPDRFGPKRVLLPALFVQAAGFVVLAQASSENGILLSGLLCGVGHGYAFPILFALVVGRASSSVRGTAMAIYTGLFDLGVLLGGPGVGVVIERFGYGVMYEMTAVIVVLGAVSFAVWDRGR
jgi:MFS family permease